MPHGNDAGFADFFSAGAKLYARFRPTYPDELFTWLAGRCDRHDLAWDCATGNGQAAVGLAAHFGRVVATDASAAQLAHARPHPRIEYRVARADASGLLPGSASVVTVAQALHWLDLPSFYAEARRVLRPAGILAVWCYNLLAVHPPVDELIEELYHSTLGGWWSAERALVDAGYRTVPFPFDELAAPAVAMTAEWTLEDLVGYLGSWSAVARYVEARGDDPVAALRPRLAAAWGEPMGRRVVRWPLHLRIGRAGRETPGPPGP